MTQLVTRVSDDLVVAVDDLVEAGIVRNRSEAVRQALAEFVDRRRRDAIGARIAQGYRDLPQADTEVGWSDEATAQMIADEPW